jgi:hypothetical protein
MTTAVADAERVDEIPTQRPCTRCEGHQHLLGHAEGLGKYRCDTCQLAIGFDLEADVPEFVIDRGLPSRYTKDVFGTVLLPEERRLRPRHGHPEIAEQS